MARYEIDMTKGNFFLKIVKFCIPLMITGVLQLFYNAADLVIVGQFSDEADAIGAVGSTNALISLVINLFMGLSVGTNVMCARRFASKDNEGLSRVIHTSVTVSLISGTVLGVIGTFFARQFLALMNNPLDLAVTYLRIYFIGMPFNMLYNFAASILRGVGDTRRPLYYLTIAGIINVILNLFFVLVFKMDVDGVAIATVISQLISCILIINCLIKTKEVYHFSFKKMSIHKEELLSIAKIGLPAGIQGTIFSISNVLIQSTVNGFGNTIINGNAAAQSIEGFVYTSMNSVYNAALAFIGQNMGAKKYKNIRKITLYCLIVVSIISIIMGGGFFLIGKQLASIYTDVPAEIEIAYIRLHYLCLPYILYGMIDVMVGILRGMSFSLTPMIVSIIGICVFRVAWIYLVFHQFGSFDNIESLHLLYISYPISWVITLAAHFITYLIVYKRRIKPQIKLA